MGLCGFKSLMILILQVIILEINLRSIFRVLSRVSICGDYEYSLSEYASWGGCNAHRAGSARLEIMPNDGNGTNFIEIPLNTSGIAGNSDTMLYSPLKSTMPMEPIAVPTWLMYNGLFTILVNEHQ